MPIHQNPEETQRGDDHCTWLKEMYSNVEQVNILDLVLISNFILEQF